MNGEIEAAVEKLSERKVAMGLTYTEGRSGDESFARLMMSGFDLDIPELDHYRREAIGANGESVARHLEQGDGPAISMATATAATWIDGLLTGMLIAEARK